MVPDDVGWAGVFFEYLFAHPSTPVLRVGPPSWRTAYVLFSRYCPGPLLPYLKNPDGDKYPLLEPQSGPFAATKLGEV